MVLMESVFIQLIDKLELIFENITACAFCGRTFRDSRALGGHVRQNHKSERHHHRTARYLGDEMFIYLQTFSKNVANKILVIRN